MMRIETERGVMDLHACQTRIARETGHCGEEDQGPFCREGGGAPRQGRCRSAPRALAKTRSGNARPKPSPVTIRRADGSVEVLSTTEFTERHGEPSWKAIDRELALVLRAYRAGQASTAQLRSFAASHGLEQRLDSALSRGAGGGRVDDLAPSRRAHTSQAPEANGGQPHQALSTELRRAPFRGRLTS